MRNRKIIVMLAGAVFLLGGCIKEEVWTPQDGPADGTTRIVLSIGDAEQVVTRSAASENESKINDAFLLIFHKKEEGWKYKSGERVDVSTGITYVDKKAPIITTKCLVERGDTLVVLLNTSIGALPAGLTPDTTPDDLNALFPSNGWNLNTEADLSFGSRLPMSGGVLVESYRDPITGALTVPGCQIRRSVAKIGLVLNIAPEDDITTFFNADNVSWGMSNVLKSSRAAVCTTEGKTSILTDLSAVDFTATGFVKQPVQSGAPLFKQSYYMPQYPNATMAMATAVEADKFAKDRTCMLLKVYDKIEGVSTFQYYRIDLYDHTAKKFIDITPNTQITVTVTKVKSYGYTTPEEALANPGSNLEYEIKVTGDNDNIVVSNGQYALSLEYDEVIYTGNGATEVSLGQVRSIAASGVQLPTVNSIILSTGVMLVGNISLSSPDPQVLKATMSGASGTITLKLGNIKKILKLTRTDVPASGKSITLMGDYSDITWIKSSPNLQIKANGTTSGTVIVSENITPTNAFALSDSTALPVFETRSAEGYFMRAGATPGCTKIAITQSAPEYVGWFGGNLDKRLIFDSHKAPIALQWYINLLVVTNAQDKLLGLNNTKVLMAQDDPDNYQAAQYCYLLNDRNANGVIDLNESVDWYLPAQKQLMSGWIVQNVLNTPFVSDYFISSTEGESESTYSSMFVDFRSGWTMNGRKTNLSWVRCCRDLFNE